MKELFNKPELEIVDLQDVDVICTSTVTDCNYANDGWTDDTTDGWVF